MIPGSFMNPPTGVLPFEMFRSFSPTLTKQPPSTPRKPSCDIYETDKEFVLKMELPEMRKEDVAMTLENIVLTVRGKRNFEEADKRENYHRMEREYGEFMRIFTLPALVPGGKIVTEFKEGVLTIRLPKSQH